MKIKVNTRQLIAVLDNAVKMSKKSDERTAADRSLVIDASDGVLGVTVSVENGVGFNIPLKSDRVDFEVLEDGSAAVFSDVLLPGVKPFLKSESVVLETVGDGKLKITGEGAGHTEIALPDVSDSGDKWDTLPSAEGKDSFTTRASHFVSAIQMCTPSGVPLVGDAVIIHPGSDGSVTVQSSETHHYSVTTLSLPVVDCQISDEVEIHSDFAPLVLSVIDLVTEDTDVLEFAFDDGEGVVVYTVRDSAGSPVATVWSPTTKIGTPVLYNQIDKLMDNMASQRVAVVTVDKSAFLATAKDALSVGKATGYSMDSSGQAELNNPVHLVVEDGRLTVSSMQVASSFTDVLDATVVGDLPDGRASFKTSMVLAEPLIHSGSFPGDAMTFSLMVMPGRGDTSTFVLSFLPDTLGDEDGSDVEFSGVEDVTHDRLMASSFTLVSQEVK